jgi:hypothetical protein
VPARRQTTKFRGTGRLAKIAEAGRLRRYRPTRVDATARRQGRLIAGSARVSEAGFVEGRNVAIEFRWAEGKLDRLPEFANDLVRRWNVAAIATNAQYSPSTVTAATSTIPPVFVTGGDPFEIGYATSLSRPGTTFGTWGSQAQILPLRPILT